MADTTVRGRFACGCEVSNDIHPDIATAEWCPRWDGSCVLARPGARLQDHLTILRIGFAIAASEGRGPWAEEP